MKNILLAALLTINFNIFSQEITSIVSVSHYINPELYIEAGVACLISDKNGNPAIGGNYLSIYNNGSRSFHINYPSGSKIWTTVKPASSLLIPIVNTNKKVLLNFRVKYVKTSPAKLNDKLEDLSKLNVLSEKVSYDKPSAGSKLKNSVAETLQLTEPKIYTAEAASIPPTTRSGMKKRAAPKIQKKQMVASEEVTECFYTPTPAYYTFYYLKVNQQVFYSDAFGVPAYSAESEGQQLLTQAWYCFVSELRTMYDEDTIYALLHDPDNDLQLGLIHLRNPFIPSAEILKTYPYTATKTATQHELVDWIKYESETYKGLKFIKVNFM